ncbi:MAG: site-specific integrase [Candidatus Thiosymbion ectosymbiont of Robbea hypermnestra]|nr:site-specific integrase [Candidatus Thiosymbion ectosymbiont of Robbea hypermnestra]
MKQGVRRKPNPSFFARDAETWVKQTESDIERGRYFQTSSTPWLHTAVVVALSTGMRKGELMGLTWRDVDLQAGRIVLQETKNGERRVVPLAGPALALLKEHAKVRRIDTDLLFPNHRGNAPIDLRTPWETALKRAGIEDFRWHDLRHSAASYFRHERRDLGGNCRNLGTQDLEYGQAVRASIRVPHRRRGGAHEYAHLRER